MFNNPRPERLYDHTFKLVALGDAAVGKTSCIRRYREGTFNDNYVATLGTIFSMKMVDVEMANGKTLRTRLILWDLAGQSGYEELRKRYMSGASIAFVAYDVTRPETFENSREWYKRFQEVCPDAVVTLVANKIDREDRKVSTSEGETAAQSMGMLFYETSAKNGDNIEHLFTDLVRRVFERLRI
ncbi:MAG: Rab family GTPase [Candidatus Thorarchaeota archaeon]